MKKKYWLISVIFIVLTLTLFTALPSQATEGPVYSYVIQNDEVKIYTSARGLKGELVIPDTIEGYPVTTIGTFAFRGQTELTAIRLPATLTSIESLAFSECSAITEVTIPDSVTTLGSEAFSKCKALKRVQLSRGMTEIPSSAFSGCSALETITFPETLKTIKGGAFKGCSSLRVLELPKTIEEIGYSVFDNCSSLEKATLPFIGHSLEDDGKATLAAIFGTTNKADLPESLKEVVILGGSALGKDAFADCLYLEKITLPASLKTIPKDAFGKHPFDNTPSLKEVLVDENSTSFTTKGNCLIETASRRLILAFDNSVIPTDGSVTVIGAYAFDHATNAKSIVVPSAIKQIEQYAFSGCTSLEEITLPFVGEKASGASKTYFGYIFGAGDFISSVDQYVPKSLKKVTVTGNCTIADSAFRDLKNITTFVATGKIAKVDMFCFFGCLKLETVRFDGSLGTIEQNAFSGCSVLREVHLPSSLTKIGSNVFSSCPSVKLFCEKGSVAESYAIKNKLSYQLVGDSDTTTEAPTTTTLPETTERPTVITTPTAEETTVTPITPSPSLPDDTASGTGQNSDSDKKDTGSFVPFIVIGAILLLGGAGVTLYFVKFRR